MHWPTHDRYATWTERIASPRTVIDVAPLKTGLHLEMAELSFKPPSAPCRSKFHCVAHSYGDIFRAIRNHRSYHGLPIVRRVAIVLSCRLAVQTHRNVDDRRVESEHVVPDEKTEPVSWRAMRVRCAAPAPFFHRARHVLTPRGGRQRSYVFEPQACTAGEARLRSSFPFARCLQVNIPTVKNR